MPPRYRVCTPGVVPRVSWYYDGPLVAGRRGELSPRGIVRGVSPWNGDVDDTLVKLYRDPVDDEGEPYLSGLRTGGITPEHALAGWGNLPRDPGGCCGRSASVAERPPTSSADNHHKQRGGPDDGPSAHRSRCSPSVRPGPQHG